MATIPKERAASASTMMRVRRDILTVLQELSREEGVTMQTVLSRALDDYRRKRLIESGNEGYAALRSNPEAWRREQEERAAWEVTLMDGIDPVRANQESASPFDVAY